MVLNKYITFLLLVLISNHTHGQIKLRPNQYEGYILMADSRKKDIIIEVEDAGLPWTFQEKVKYFDKSLATGVRIKRENKKDIIPGEVVEYGFGARKFIYVNHHVKDKKDKNIVSSAFSKFKDEKNSDFFIEVIKDDKIQVLIFYVAPKISDEDYENDDIMDKYKKTSEATFDILLSKKDTKPTSVSDINFKSFFADCLFVVKKFEDGKYEIKPSKGLNVFFTKGGLGGSELLSAVNFILKDYADNCGNY